MIGIKNLTGEKIVGRYDGKDYSFVADEQVVTPISEDAARHIFGYGEKDKSRALLRLGWVGNQGTMETATERLGKVKFLAAEEPVFKDPENTVDLPTSAGAEPRAEVGLSPDEQRIAGTLHKPDKSQKSFAK